jgi:drug/metabolite transporter, DME family
MTDTPESGAAYPRSLTWRERWTALPPAFQGLLLGSFASLCYSITNVGLRQVAVRTDLDWAMWVASWKVMPTAVAGWILMAGLMRRGISIIPPRDILLSLIANGLLMQFCGNVLFQYGLSRAGLALSVPLCFASLITTSAILGRIVLHDPIRPRMLVAMGMLMLAVVLLSQGTRAASASTLMRWQDAALGAAAAFGSGIGFAISGVVIRRSIRHGIPISVVLGYSATVGMCPMLIAIAQQGWKPLTLVLDRGGYVALLSAGILNALGFFAVSEALRHLPVVRVNLINASQAAMGGLMGVLLFHEAPTWWLLAGTLTTISSLVVLGTEES